MPAYNAEDFIQEAITSVLRQDYICWELIVIDDGSDDDTANIVKNQMVIDNRIRYVYQKNLGLGSARNAALSLTRGDWITFLDSDDIWTENKLSKQINFVEKNNTAQIIFSQGYYLYQTNGSIENYDSLCGHYDSEEMFNKLLIHNHIPVLSVLFNKKILQQIGYQDTDLFIRGCEDWDYWLRICIAGYSFYGLTDRLFYYRVHPKGISNNANVMRNAGIYVITKNFSNNLTYDINKIKIRSKMLGSIPFLFKQLFKQNRLKIYFKYCFLIVRVLSIFLMNTNILHKKVKR